MSSRQHVRSVVIPDELWDPAVEAARRDAPDGERPSTSAWLREAIREKLERDGDDEGAAS